MDSITILSPQFEEYQINLEYIVFLQNYKNHQRISFVYNLNLLVFGLVVKQLLRT